MSSLSSCREGLVGASKSDQDPKQYRYFTLPNRLRVLLVRVANCVVTDNKNVDIVMGVIGIKIVEVISGVGPGWA